MIDGVAGGPQKVTGSAARKTRGAATTASGKLATKTRRFSMALSFTVSANRSSPRWRRPHDAPLDHDDFGSNRSKIMT
jgi:hypothetical protein